ncbi:MAG: MOP flippase family protein [Bacteroidota bacterium]|nr:MOP flippase family protein [Bacteroidota bacterium]
MSGLKWSGTSQLIRQAIQIGTTLILARILQPMDFGLMGMAIVIIGFLNVFKDVGTSAAIIQKQNISQQLLSSIFWLNVFIGIVISVIIFFTSNILAHIFNEERLGNIIRFFIITFFSGTLISIQQALLEKEMSFKKLARYEIIAVLIGAIVGIYSAYNGFGVWSLVLQTTSASIVLCVFLWLQPSHWTPMIYFQWSDIKTIHSFSSNLTGFTIVNYFLRNADSFIIGRFLGATDLGFYSLAYKVMIVPLQNLTAVISRVMFPLLSSINNDNMKMRETYSKIVLSIAFFSFPFFAWLMLVNNEFVSVIFGERWLPVAPILFILSPVGLFQSIDTTTGSLFQAKGRTDILFLWSIFTGIIAVTSFYLGLPWGLKGVALGYVIATILWTYHGFSIPLKLIEQNVFRFFSQFSRIVVTVVAAYFIALYLKQGTAIVFLNNRDKLITVTVVMFVIYFCLSFIFNRFQLKQLHNVVITKSS